jgi:hypothetical protein
MRRQTKGGRWVRSAPADPPGSGSFGARGRRSGSFGAPAAGPDLRSGPNRGEQKADARVRSAHPVGRPGAKNGFVPLRNTPPDRGQSVPRRPRDWPRLARGEMARRACLGSRPFRPALGRRASSCCQRATRYYRNRGGSRSLRSIPTVAFGTSRTAGGRGSHRAGMRRVSSPGWLE